MRRRLPGDERRRSVLEAARRVFLASGYGGARVSAIAAEAGVDKAMVYRFWDSKEALFDEAIADPLEKAVGRALASMSVPPPDAEHDDVRKRATEFLRDLLGAMREIVPMLGVVLATDAEVGERFYREQFEPRMTEIRDVMVGATERVHSRPYDPDVGVRLVYGMCYFLALDDRFGSGTGKTDDELAAEMLSVLFDGLVVRDTKPVRRAGKPAARRAAGKH